MTLNQCQSRGWHDWHPEQDATEHGAFTVWVCDDCGLELSDPDELADEDEAIATPDANQTSEPMTHDRTHYDAWIGFHGNTIPQPMSADELRQECGRLSQARAPSPELLLAHAMLIIERLTGPDSASAALDHELVMIEAATDSFSGARDAMHAVVHWHVAAALEPKVSLAARDLIAQGRAQAIAAIAALGAEQPAEPSIF